MDVTADEVSRTRAGLPSKEGVGRYFGKHQLQEHLNAALQHVAVHQPEEPLLAFAKHLTAAYHALPPNARHTQGLASSSSDPQEMLKSAAAPVGRFANRIRAAVDEELRSYFDELAAAFRGQASDVPIKIQVGIVGEVVNLGLDALRAALEAATTKNVGLCAATSSDTLSLMLDFGGLQVADRLTEERLADAMEDATTSGDHGLDPREVELLHEMLAAEASPAARSRLRREATQKLISGDRLFDIARELQLLEDSQSYPADQSHRAAEGGGEEGGGGDGSGREGAQQEGESVMATETGLYGPLILPRNGSDGGSPLPVLSGALLFESPRSMALDDLISWDLDILALNTTELMQLAALVFQQSGVLTTFGIPTETLAAFISAIGTRYHTCPYHNFNHGVHVLLGCWLLVRESNMLGDASKDGIEGLTPLHTLALLVAAVGHDVDHPGVNNAFLIAANTPVAIRYNDASVLESHHCATTFAILGQRHCDMLATLRDDQRKEVRRLMIASVMATDMAHHQAMVKELNHAAAERIKAEQSGSPPPLIPPTFSLRVICHLADLGNCCIDWHLSKEWAVRVCQEAVDQAAHERRLGMAHGKTSQYSTDELAARQLVFLDGWVRPFLKAASALYPPAKERLAVSQQCRGACKSITLRKAWKGALIRVKSFKDEPKQSTALA